MCAKTARDCFEELDRSLFVPCDLKAYVWIDGALPIGYGQTISQPSLVLRMTELLDVTPDSKVLEIGTGSGFQTALLACLAERVYTVERVPELAEQARERLTSLGYCNILFRSGDGSEGWPKYSPYSRIMVTAAALSVPEELVNQLAPGGRMVIPVGSEGLQELLLVNKAADGALSTQKWGAVSFVEMKGRYGWKGPAGRV